ncbi:TetR/AcrR family transcriptional regulator [Streptomyces bathyalis]|uniref:TetR/AcrR family transcriptional regulator n=1 Tax=Streptomyces bathyalis TaxID=2710756 RepID=A0A7T1WVG3_9ACTN|nr:TetR/AcrR family transcriptional regulator [Streptomyces bathyalis]QPP08950.1 TetR/AcrR family transcriptional regulator [Streptomyces bathyalis]
MSTSNGSGQPARTRRRGKALEEAIFAAALEELAEEGFEGATMEGIAERAHTGKSSIYRRWQTKQELVLDALRQGLPRLGDPLPDTGSLRGDLLYLLTRMAGVLDAPPGRALRGMIVDGRHPALVSAIDERLIQPRIQLIVDVLRRAADRGEISAAAPVLLAGTAGPAMVVQEQLLRGRPLSEARIAEVIDHVVFPALGILPPGLGDAPRRYRAQ